MIGYKIVHRKLDKYWSYTCPYTEYRADQPTVQDIEKQGPFAVFDSIEHADALLLPLRSNPVPAHAIIVPNFHIFCVEYEPSDEQVLWRLCHDGKLEWPIRLCPKGTILASSVVLREIVR